jgi:large subunit ribosomal protein L15e
MGIYKYIRQAWSQPRETLGERYRHYLMQWRREPSTLRIDYPTRLDRARSLGYRAKQGFVLVRQRVIRGGHNREDWSGGRHSSNMSVRMNLRLNYQAIAERRANDAYPNCEVLGSYLVGKDGRQAWYEIILVDRSHPVILADPALSWVGLPANKGRAYRGLTSAQRRSRGLRSRGKGAEHIRPGTRANDR